MPRQAICMLLRAALLTLSLTFTAAAQPATPLPVGRAEAVASGETIVVARPSRRAAGVILTIPVTNQSDQPATVLDDGTVLTITVPTGPTAKAEAVYVGLDARVVPCPTEPGAPHIARCTITEERATQVGVRFTSTAMAPATETVPLVAGCNNIALTWPDGTATALVARAVSPDTALDAMWQYDPSSDRFIGWSSVPGAPNDLLVVRRLAAVFLCIHEPGTLARPAG